MIRIRTARRETPRASTAALVRKGAYAAAAALTGFLLGSVRFEESFSPFAAAYTAGADAALLLPAGLGAAVGAALFLPPLAALKYAGAVLLAVLFRFGAAWLTPDAGDGRVRPFAAAVSVFLCGAAVSFTQIPGVEPLLLSFCEAVIAGVTAAFWRRVFVLLPEKTGLFAAAPGDSAAFLLCGSMLLYALTPLQLGQVSPARILCCFLLQLFALCAGEAAGAVTGISVGLVLGFSDAQPHLIFALPAAGLLCGVCRSLGKTAVATGFLVCDALFLILRGDVSTAFPAVLEAGIASVALLLLPQRALQFAAARLRPLSPETCADEGKALLRLRLGKTAGAVRDLADAVQAVCRILTKTETGADPLTDAVKADACALCAKRNYCWERAAPLTRAAFAEAAAVLRRDGKLYAETLPARLSVTCRDPGRLTDALNEKYGAFTAREAVRGEIVSLKETAAEQFRSLSDLLTATGDALCAAGRADPYTAGLIRAVFGRAGIRFDALAVRTDADGRYVLELSCPAAPPEADAPALLEKLYAKTNLRFSPPVVSRAAPAGVIVTYCETPPLRVDFYKKSAAGSGETFCADACEGFSDGAGRFCCVLSDGMGTGREAAVNAAMVCALTSRLLRAGLAEDAALAAVNAALLVNASEEMLATADVCRIDLFSGHAAFLKAGGAFSAVRRDAKTVILEKSSMPLGILRDTKPEHAALTLAAGDAVLLMSDGADRLPPQFFKDLFYRHRSADAKELVSLTLAEAVKRAPVGRQDDVTVACMRLCEAD